MRRLALLGLVIVVGVALTLAVASRRDDHASQGPLQAEIENRAPYGQGAEVGETYEYALYTHCGIEWTRIDGVWWQADRLLSDGSANPPPGWGNPYERGEVEIVDDDRAVFRGGPSDVGFTRTTAVDAPFVCA